MKTIIAGSRHITNRAYLDAAIQTCPFAREITEVVCGGAEGVDRIGDQWARDAGLPVHYFLVGDAGILPLYGLLNLSRDDGYRNVTRNVTVASDWVWQGKAAGPIRNDMMAIYADALVAVWDGESRGTKGMIALARQHGLRIHEYVVGDEVQQPLPLRKGL